MDISDSSQEKVDTDLARFNQQIDSVSAGEKEFLRNHWLAELRMWIKTLLVGIPCWLGAGVFFFYMMPILAQTNDPRAGSFMLLPVIVALYPFIFPISFYARIKKRMKGAYNQQLAKLLGLTHKKGAAISTVKGFLFTVGYRPTITDVFSGEYRLLPVRFFTYTFGNNEKYDRSTDYSLMCCEISFTGNSPELFVVGKDLYKTLRREISVNWRPPNTHVLHTDEGNFSKNFEINIQNGNDIEALQILEPNVMEKLLVGYENFGFDSYQDKLTVFTKSHPDTKEGFRSLVTLADSLYDKLIPEVTGVTPMEKPQTQVPTVSQM